MDLKKAIGLLAAEFKARGINCALMGAITIALNSEGNS